MYTTLSSLVKQGVLSKNPDNVRVLALRAYVLQRLGRSEEAVDAALKVLRDHQPEDPGVLTPLQYVFRCVLDCVCAKKKKKPNGSFFFFPILKRGVWVGR